ncbi:wall-associated receptor kinase-like 1 [Vitis vinifera]|uniref:wall-associated receptor kinase-like 1 n=1 Tax=Vitis vinifera TaxID=29760 RepID=UPI00053FB0B5|nr:wall-associated receptor kinase-like 1 [Vitis vinifera]|eukprot:XP_010648101.1 PREDICTED: wall-associated receptor kinase-like 1 [Vitis vinifera]
MRTVQWLLQISLLLWLSKGLAATQAKPGCQEWCGDVDIPYPFGIGSSGCYFDEWFEVTCNNSTDPPKPFLKGVNLEVLNVSLHGTVRVNNPVLLSQNCSGKPSNDTQWWEGGPFSFSNTYTRFTAVGCSAMAYFMQDDTVIGGCMTLCKKDVPTAAKNASCYGLECCQTQVPPGLLSFTANLDTFPEGSADEQEPCKYAFMVDQEWFISNVPDPHTMKDMEYVPAVLDWRIYNATCDASTSNLNTSTSFCGENTICSTDTQTSSLTCSCPPVYEGNPYLPQGCEGETLDKLLANRTRAIMNATHPIYLDESEQRHIMVLPGCLNK